MISVPAAHTTTDRTWHVRIINYPNTFSVSDTKPFTYHLRFMYAAARFPYSMALWLALWMARLYSWMAWVHCWRANASFACCLMLSRWGGRSVQLLTHTHNCQHQHNHNTNTHECWTLPGDLSQSQAAGRKVNSIGHAVCGFPVLYLCSKQQSRHMIKLTFFSCFASRQIFQHKF